MEWIERVKIGNTGNGPCIEVEFEDGTHLCISDVDGCGMPKEDSWVAEWIAKNGESIEIFEMPRITLWAGCKTERGMEVSEYAPAIMAEMLKWGSDSFGDGPSPERTWLCMIEDLGPNTSLLTKNQQEVVKALFLINVAVAQGN